MTDRIDYCETPEFQKDFKKLLKKFKTLEGDFELAKRATIELYHIQIFFPINLIKKFYIFWKKKKKKIFPISSYYFFFTGSSKYVT